MSSDNNIAIMGAGPMGLILSNLIAPQAENLKFWVSDRRTAQKLATSRRGIFNENDINLPRGVEVFSGFSAFRTGNWTIFVCVAAQRFEESMEKLTAALSPAGEHRIIITVKGFAATKNRKKYSVLTFTDYLNALAAERKLEHLITGVLNGPGVINELAAGQLCFFNIGCDDPAAAESFSKLLLSNLVHTSISHRRFDCEISGILIEPIAIACGIAGGLPYCGANFMGEVATLGFSDLRILSEVFEINEDVLLSRSGLADLIASVISPRGRNREYGENFTRQLARNPDDTKLVSRIKTFLNPIKVIEEHVLKLQNQAEGVLTLPVITEIAREKGVDVPLYQLLHDILSRRVPPQELLKLSGKYNTPGSDVKVNRVRSKRYGTQFIRGHEFQKILERKILKQFTDTQGMQARIKKQAPQIISAVKKRITLQKHSRLSKNRLKQEVKLWEGLLSAEADFEQSYLENLIEYYVKETADNYRMGIRETLLWFLAPLRFVLSGCRPGSAFPKTSGAIRKIRSLSTRYNIFYTPTHRSHLDSVEIAFALARHGLPLPRYAADANLMSNPIWSWFLKSMGAYAVDRERRRNILYLECLSEYSQVMLESGIPSLVYPEGTRSRTGEFLHPKTGLLSTAVEAYRSSGTEIIIVPITISYESIPEDQLFSRGGMDLHLVDYIRKRKQVYLDFCNPLRVSDFISSSDPLQALGEEISRSWRKNIKILPNHIVARLLFENNLKIALSDLQPLIKEFVKNHSGNYLTDNADQISRRGLRSLRKAKLIKIENEHVSGLSAELLRYYSNLSLEKNQSAFSK